MNSSPIKGKCINPVHQEHLEVFKSYLYSKRFSENTIRSYSNALRHFFKLLRKQRHHGIR